MRQELEMLQRMLALVRNSLEAVQIELDILVEREAEAEGVEWGEGENS